MYSLSSEVVLGVASSVSFRWRRGSESESPDDSDDCFVVVVVVVVVAMTGSEF